MIMGAVAVRHDPASVAVVRHSIADDLSTRSVDRDSIDDVLLVASELVANAVLHACAPEADSDTSLAVDWEVAAGFVTLHVNDGSSVMPMPRSSGSNQTRGRGLAIVAALAQDWGVDRTGLGKRVWARIPISLR